MYGEATVASDGSGFPLTGGIVPGPGVVAGSCGIGPTGDRHRARCVPEAIALERVASVSPPVEPFVDGVSVYVSCSDEHRLPKRREVVGTPAIRYDPGFGWSVLDRIVLILGIRGRLRTAQAILALPFAVRHSASTNSPASSSCHSMASVTGTSGTSTPTADVVS